MTTQSIYLPHEIQLEIMSHLDSSSLARFCRANRWSYAAAEPLLWRHVSLLKATPGSQEDFFAACSRLAVEQPEHWYELATHVRSLEVQHMRRGFASECSSENEEQNSDLRREMNIYKTMANFQNLERLSLFVEREQVLRPSCGISLPLDDVPHLKNLELGGIYASRGTLLELLPTTVEKIEVLSLFAPEHGVPSLTSLHWQLQYFARLQTLHLSTVAESVFNQDEGEDIEWVLFCEEIPPTLAWAFHDQDNLAILGEWAHILSQVSQTVVHLTFEDCYPVQNGAQAPDYMIDPAACDEDARAASENTANASKRIASSLLHLIASLKWPKLKTRSLVGLEWHDQTAIYSNILQRLQPQVHVVHQSSIVAEYDDRGFDHFVMQGYHMPGH